MMTSLEDFSSSDSRSLRTFARRRPGRFAPGGINKTLHGRADQLGELTRKKRLRLLHPPSAGNRFGEPVQIATNNDALLLGKSVGQLKLMVVHVLTESAEARNSHGHLAGPDARHQCSAAGMRNNHARPPDVLLKKLVLHESKHRFGPIGRRRVTVLNDQLLVD